MANETQLSSALEHLGLMLAVRPEAFEKVRELSKTHELTCMSGGVAGRLISIMDAAKVVLDIELAAPAATSVSGGAGELVEDIERYLASADEFAQISYQGGYKDLVSSLKDWLLPSLRALAASPASVTSPQNKPVFDLVDAVFKAVDEWDNQRDAILDEEDRDELNKYLAAALASSAADNSPQKTVKTLEMWEAIEMRITEFLQAGDEVDEEMVNHFGGVVSPQYCSYQFTQVGEAEREEKGRLFYMTFGRFGERHVYLGILPPFKQPKHPF